jgi:predicted transcriptional regulator
VTDEQLIELFNERASITEYEAKQPRATAELAAYGELRKLVGRSFVLPIEIRRVVSDSVNKELSK